MEKVIYALWRPADEPIDGFNQRLLQQLAPALLNLTEVRGLRLNLQDDAVARASGLRLRCDAAPGANDDRQPDAVAQLWLDASHDVFRRPIDELMTSCCARIAAWQVVSSTIIRNVDHPSALGVRTAGWSQMCFLTKPDRLDHTAWRHNWQMLHTAVAIDTQANFEYIQNLIVRPLIDGPQQYVAVVEECFPEAAMDDPYAFFDAVGNEPRFAANTAAMAQSCARFIDAGCVDLLPTSQFDLRAPG